MLIIRGDIPLRPYLSHKKNKKAGRRIPETSLAVVRQALEELWSLCLSGNQGKSIQQERHQTGAFGRTMQPGEKSG